MTTSSPPRPIVVLGASGKTGRRIVERLRARDLPVRLGSRSAHPPFDWQDPETWAPALEGASAAYVSYFPDLAAPGAPEAIAALTEDGHRGARRPQRPRHRRGPARARPGLRAISPTTPARPRRAARGTRSWRLLRHHRGRVDDDRA